MRPPPILPAPSGLFPVGPNACSASARVQPGGNPRQSRNRPSASDRSASKQFAGCTTTSMVWNQYTLALGQAGPIDGGVRAGKVVDGNTVLLRDLLARFRGLLGRPGAIPG